MLHIITQSLSQASKSETALPCLALGDAVLLMGDGVYNTSHEKFLHGNSIFAIDEDCATRGLQKHAHIHYIDYAGMVALTEQHNPIITWR